MREATHRKTAEYMNERVQVRMHNVYGCIFAKIDFYVHVHVTYTCNYGFIYVLPMEICKTLI